MMLSSLLQASLLLLSSARVHPPTPSRPITESWGAYSPFFSAGTYEPPPNVCAIDQVHILERHGARFPTLGAGATIISAINKLQSVSTYTDARLDFLKNFTYSLGVADLVPFGAVQSQQSGRLAYERYRGLISERNGPFVRASSGQRVVDSATNWTAGFSVASNHVYNPSLSVILSESGNDTLDDNGCPNAGSSDVQTSTWLSVFAPPITERLNVAAPGANLVDADIYALISMCAFHTVATAQGANLTLSPFCALFDDSEFADFEYSMDLDKYYGTGYGAFLGRVQGVGYINELLARLTSTPVNDSTQTNTTLTSNPTTFPLNRTLYADFSHDNQMIAIYAAMGLFEQQKALDPTTRTGTGTERTWIASRLVPFSGRMVVERLTCQRGRTTEQAVRILVNDALQPLDFCAGQSEEKLGLGVCELTAFVESQSYARNGGEGEWEQCFT
ncbi:phytase [Mycena amicta]|nr:phytase [Mycena amicta]